MPTIRDTAELYDNPGGDDRARRRKGEQNAFSRALGEEPKKELVPVQPAPPKNPGSKPEPGKGGLSDG
jgi:hypothetical protein